MKITFYAHASFRLETPDVSLVTDPYTPGPRGAGFAPIDEAADIVLMSSATDRFHSDPSHVRGDPTVIDALLDVPPEGLTVRGIPVRAFPATESLTFDFRRDPDANAMSLFTIGGLRVLHMGDTGNPVPPEQLAALAGQVDVLFALAGGHATIALDDLDAAIEAIGPRVIVPMHYWHPRGVLPIEPVETFLGRHPPETVRRASATCLDLEPGRLPSSRRIVVLEQSR